jgi:hypothetical protein
VIRSFALSIALCLIVTGCASVKGFPDPSTSSESSADIIKMYPKATAVAQFAAPVNGPNGMSREAYRNLVLEAYINDVDTRFGKYERELYQQGVTFGIGADWLVLALSGGASVASAGAANALSAATVGVTGARASVDKEALYNKTLITLMAQMVAGRQTALLAIRKGELETAEAYPLTRGFSDIEAYERAGTLPGALVGVAANAGNQTKNAESDLSKLPLVVAVSANVQALREPLATCIKNMAQKDLDAAVKSSAYTDLNNSIGLSASTENSMSQLLHTLAQLQTVDQVNKLSTLTKCR